MSCTWCSFNFNSIDSYFGGYITFDKYGTKSGLRFCSINCCSAYINTDKYDSVVDNNKKLDMLYSYYGIECFIVDAKDPKRLKKFGGDLTYEQYRSNFICPDIDGLDVKPKTHNYSYDYDYDYDYDYNRREKERIEYYDEYSRNEEEDIKDIEANNE